MLFKLRGASGRAGKRLEPGKQGALSPWDPRAAESPERKLVARLLARELGVCRAGLSRSAAAQHVLGVCARHRGTLHRKVP